MREKRLYYIFTFSNTTSAMAAEKLCREENIPARLIPLPSAISAGCGLALRMRAEDHETYSGRIKGYERKVVLEML